MADLNRDEKGREDSPTGNGGAGGPGRDAGYIQASQYAEARPMAGDLDGEEGPTAPATGDGDPLAPARADVGDGGIPGQGGDGHPARGSGARGHEDTLDDGHGNRYCKSEVLEIVLAYKKDSRNFFWGDLQRNCNKMSRKFDDRWYAWTKEMMENLDRNESRMRSIVHKHTHSAIQSICKDVGGALWRMKTVDKLKNLVGSIRQIEKLVKSEKGVETCWGRMRYMGASRHKMEGHSRASRKKAGKAPLSDILDYAEYKKCIWNKHYKDQEEKDDIYKLYDRN